MEKNNPMKRIINLALISSLLIVGGCARFSTNQVQLDTLDDAGKVLTRQTSTKATSTTFFDSKSALTSFKATQTDKSQSASVGSLSQEASGSNAVNLVDIAVQAAVKAAVTSVVPKP